MSILAGQSTGLQQVLRKSIHREDLERFFRRNWDQSNFLLKTTKTHCMHNRSLTCQRGSIFPLDLLHSNKSPYEFKPSILLILELPQWSRSFPSTFDLIFQRRNGGAVAAILKGSIQILFAIAPSTRSIKTSPLASDPIFY